MKKFEHDLTKGDVFTELVLFAIPFFVSNLIQSVYSVADMMILGNFAGTVSITAVNTGGQIMVVLTNLAGGLAGGGTVMIGQYLGANKKELINKTISTLLLTLFGLGIVLGAITIFFSDAILNVMQMPVEALKEAKDYLVISALGILFIFAYNALSAIMRGMGDSKTPLIFVAVAAVTNIVLDYVLIAIYHKGAAGAAFATIFAQGLSVVLCVIYLLKNDFMFDFKLSSFIMDSKLLNTLMKVGLPNALQMVFTNISFLFLTAMINHIGGVAAGAASGVVNIFNAFAILPCVAISTSTSAMISQNMGAHKEDRVKKATQVGFILCVSVCAIVFIIANVFAKQIFDLFGGDADMIEIGIQYIHAFSFEYASLGVIVGFNAVFIGTGNGWLTMISNSISTFIVRMPVAYLLGAVLGLGVVGVGWAIPIATAVGAIGGGIIYATGVWKKNMIEI